MPKLRREITTQSEFNDSLSYITDYNTMMIAPGINTLKFDKTLAYGTGSAYTYPKAIFQYFSRIERDLAPLPYDWIGSRKLQIYPPIIKASINTIYGCNNDIIRMYIGETPENFVKINGTIATAYLFKGMFNVSYSTVQKQTSQLSNSEKTNITIPSFNPSTESNSNRFAYVNAGMMFIKDPLFANVTIPSSLPRQYHPTSRPGSGPNMVTYFSISPNHTVLDPIASRYVSNHLPLAYDKSIAISSNPAQNILRRSFQITDDTGLKTVQVSGGNNPTFKFYKPNGTEITAESPLEFFTKAGYKATDFTYFSYQCDYYLAGGGVSGDHLTYVMTTSCLAGQIDDIYLIKVPLTYNNEIQGQGQNAIAVLGEKLRISNSGQNSNWRIACSVRGQYTWTKSTVEQEAKRLLPQHSGSTAELPGYQTQIYDISFGNSTSQYVTNEFNIQAQENKNTNPSVQALNIPGLTIWPKSTVSSITYVDYTEIQPINFRPFVSPSQNFPDYPSNDDSMEYTYDVPASVNNYTVPISYSGYTYFIVAANITVPYYEGTGKSACAYLKKGVVMLNSPIAAKKVSATAATYELQRCTW